jgi:ABC-type amino acid transport substrate-binding protein
MSLTPGKYAAVGTNYFLTKYPTVWTFRKNDPEALKLRDVMFATIDAMIKDGTYISILKKWGVEDGAVIRPALNSLTVEQ